MKKNLLLLFLFIIALRLIVVIALDYWSVSSGNAGFNPIDMGGDDGEYHYSIALSIANGSVPPEARFFHFFIGNLMKITGAREVIWFKLLNWFVGCATIFIAIRLYYALRRNGNQPANSVNSIRSVAILLLLVGLYPSVIYYTSASLVRDAWIFFFHLASILCAVRFTQQKSAMGKLVYAALFVSAIVFLGLLRWYAAISIILGIIVWFAYRPNLVHRSVKSVITTIVVVGIIGIIIFGVAKVCQFMPGSEQFDSLYKYRSGYQNSAGSNLGIDLPNASASMFVPLFLYSFVSNVFGPLPWQIMGASQGLAFIAEVPMLLIIAYGIWKRRRLLDAASWFLIIQALTWFALISFTNDNIGTATRLRALGWNCILVTYAYLLVKPINPHYSPELVAASIDNASGIRL